ncbi:hypothetical protein KEM54_006762 [Ascosphaera aggregata]|nr:hypothetical protein KEM54_006762 [Ascosphaera aggregata]
MDYSIRKVGRWPSLPPINKVSVIPSISHGREASDAQPLQNLELVMGCYNGLEKRNVTCYDRELNNNTNPTLITLAGPDQESTECPKTVESSASTTCEDVVATSNQCTSSKIPSVVGVVQNEIEYLHLDFDTQLPPLATPAPAELPMPDLSETICAMDWSPWRQNFVMIFIAYFGCYSAVAAASYNSPMNELMEKWDVGVVVYELGSTLFSLGFAIAPMVLAPFSELTGRRWVILGSGILFTFCLAMSGVTESFAGMLLSRFFIGCGGSVFSALLGGIISDMYPTEELNTPMAIFSAATLFGTGYGPLICGYMVSRHTWRWAFYMQAICNGAILVYGYLFLRESRADVLLSRRAAQLNKWYEELEATGNLGVVLPVDPEKPSATTRVVKLRWKCRSDDQRQSIMQIFIVSIYRPFNLLVTEPVVFFFSLWVAFAWGILFLTFSAIPLVYSSRYGFGLEEESAVFSTMCVGTLVAFCFSVLEDKWLRKYHPEKISKPEHRLYFSCVESICLPVGLFWFGWTCFSSVHWIVPTIGIAVATMGIFSIFLSCFNFLADCYGHYASSVLAAQSFLRNLFGGVFALVTHNMYTNMGFSAASSLLGAVLIASKAAVLTLVPWALVLKSCERGKRSNASSAQQPSQCDPSDPIISVFGDDSHIPRDNAVLVRVVRKGNLYSPHGSARGVSSCHRLMGVSKPDADTPDQQTFLSYRSISSPLYAATWSVYQGIAACIYRSTIFELANLFTVP